MNPDPSALPQFPNIGEFVETHADLLDVAPIAAIDDVLGTWGERSLEILRAWESQSSERLTEAVKSFAEFYGHNSLVGLVLLCIIYDYMTFKEFFEDTFRLIQQEYEKNHDKIPSIEKIVQLLRSRYGLRTGLLRQFLPADVAYKMKLASSAPSKNN